MSVVVSIASHVARGHVGNSVAVFALQRLGIEVWDVPTVLLPHHPGHGPGTRIVTPSDTFATMLADLSSNGRLSAVSGIVSGYLGDPAHAEVIANLVDAARQANPDLVYCCDPVIGDAGALYVDPTIASAIRNHLIPRADLATPNAFELAWLSGQDGAGAENDELIAMARRLGPAEVVVTSAQPMMRGQAATLAVTGTEALLAEAPATTHPPHGLGDLCAALLLARRLDGVPLPESMRRAVASVHDLAIQTERQGRDEMPLAREQQRLIQSSIAVQMRHLVTK